MNKVVIGQDTGNIPDHIRLGTIIVIHHENRGDIVNMVVRSCSPRNAPENTAHVILADIASGNLWSSKFMLAVSTMDTATEFVTRAQVEEYINQYGSHHSWSIVESMNVTLEDGPED